MLPVNGKMAVTRNFISPYKMVARKNKIKETKQYKQKLLTFLS